jgi:hypothetical protein
MGALLETAPTFTILNHDGFAPSRRCIDRGGPDAVPRLAGARPIDSHAQKIAAWFNLFGMSAIITSLHRFFFKRFYFHLLFLYIPVCALFRPYEKNLYQRAMIFY